MAGMSNNQIIPFTQFVKQGAKKVPLFYVYELAYPNGHVFYVGKGQGNRIYSHKATSGATTSNYDIRRIIEEIESSGGTVLRNKVLETTSEALALAAEYERIRIYGSKNLTNRKGAEGSGKFYYEMYRRGETLPDGKLGKGCRRCS